MAAPLPRDFYDRDTVQVARDLLGCLLVHEVGGRLRAGRIVETEAYAGPHDLACHASRGRTPRTEVLFGPPGHAYVYLCYGLHWLMNAVTEREGHGSAVLFRAVEPVRGVGPEVRTAGPALLSAALRISGKQNRIDLTAGRGLWIEGPDRPVGESGSARRVGVDYAGEWAQRPWRFYLKDSDFVSRPRPPGALVVQGASASRGRSR